MGKNNKSKKVLQVIGLFIFFSMFLFVSVSAEDNSCSLNVSLINQDPYPAIPNDYVEVVFQISGVQNSNCEGAWFELIPSYPFSLDVNDTSRTLEGGTWTSNYKNDWMVAYKLRVDKEALDGAPEVEIHYAPGYWDSGSYIHKKFNITIQDSRTNFDAVIQESTNSEVSIAIANTGKYVANSVVVRIPEQDGFRTTGTDGQMVGNLDSGDYTIVSFSITSMMQRNMQTSDSDKDVKPNFQNQESNLQFDIYYTDALGERRIVNMELPLQMASTLLTEDGEMPEGFPGRNMGQQDSGINWTFWIIIVVLIIGGFILYKKYPEQTKEFYTKSKQKIKRLFNKKKQSNNTSNAIPDWIKNDKNKEKKK